MDTSAEARRKIEQIILELEARIADCQARLPAHSIPPGILAELDQLDEQLAEAHQRLKSLDHHAAESLGETGDR